MHRTATESCGLGRALTVIGGKWKSTIIWLLHEEPMGFGALRRKLPGISEKILSEQLRSLEQEQVVDRHLSDGPVIRTTYSLTPRGQELNAAVHALALWGSSYPAESEAEP